MALLQAELHREHKVTSAGLICPNELVYGREE